MGYVPLFDSITKGTLYGRWPDIGLWPIVLALSDRHGVVDVALPVIANITGLPAGDVESCMRRFCEPDPQSRSKEEGGARLVRLDPDRSWGWRIVNHSAYREKARKTAYDSARTDSGRDAERKKMSRRVPIRPDASRALPLSDSNADSDSNKNKNKNPEGASAPGVVGLDPVAWSQWVEYRVKRKPAIKPESLLAAQREMAALGPAQAAAVQHSIAQGYQGLVLPKDLPKQVGKTYPGMEGYQF